MKQYTSSKLISIILLVILLVSCKENKYGNFIVEGNINGADSSIIYLEKRTLDDFTIIDSIKLSKDGNFKFEVTSPQYPEFYVLKLDDQIINLAVDSIETITINSTKKDFGTGYKIDGSTDSQKIKEIMDAYYKLYIKYNELNSLYAQDKLSSKEYAESIQNATTEYKDLTSKLILVDKNSMAAYFALFQQIDGYMIFDPSDKKDLAIFQAIATNWDQQKPDSPRTEHLKNFTLSALATMRKTKKDEKLLDSLSNKIETRDNDFYNISLSDANGRIIDLSSLKNKIVILDFSIYSSEYSPLHNINLNKAYSKYKRAVEIYQVSFDHDAHIWKNSAVNLPWICVRSSNNNSAELIQKFNITDLPTTYILDKNGLIVKRVNSYEDLNSTIEKNL